MSTYPYAPLNLPYETRLLTVQPGAEDDDLKCSLSHIKISPGAGEKEIKYEALSYCWSKCTDKDPPTPNTYVPYVVNYPGLQSGSTWYEQFQQYLIIPGFKTLYYELGGRAPPGTISCDGVEFPVGGELFGALKALRAFHKNKRFKIWIDALCINQDDLSERNEHIKIMDKIYKRARVVRVWLGEEFGKEVEALATLGEIDAIIYDLKANPELGNDRAEIQDAFQDHEKYKAINWEALGSVLSRSWFQRVWVLQEMVNAKKATVHIGEYNFGWSSFTSSMSILRGYSLDSPLEDDIGSSCLDKINWLSKHFNGHPADRVDGLTVLEALGETKVFRSTQPVDKIYGLLSLFPEALEDVQVNYSDSVEEVFTQFTIKLLTNRKKLDILNHCTPPTEPKLLKLPSWVPDWSQPFYTEPFTLRGLASQAAGDTQPKFTIDPDSKTLRIYGKLIDRITHFERHRVIPSKSRHWKPKNSFEKDYQTAEEIRQAGLERYLANDLEWHGSIMQIATKNLTTPIPAELWRVYMCNRTRENEVPDESCALGFKMWLAMKFWGKGPNEALSVAKKIGDIPDSEEVDDAVNTFAGAFSKWCYNRRFFATEGGLFGWGMEGIQEGDEICVLYGGEYPFVIHPVDDGKYTMVSDCYVYGYMDGEALVEDFKEQEFLIV
jgi:hypothetical protein